MAKNIEKPQLIRGTIRVHPRGFGFVQQEKPPIYPQDIFIPKHLTQMAVDGDQVEVEVNQIISNKGPEGKVVAILERSRTHLAGIVYDIDYTGETYAYAPLLGENQPIIIKNAKEEGLKSGDRVVLQITHWGEKDEEAEATLSHKMGSIHDPSIDVKAAIEEFDIRSDFPIEVIEEAKTFGKKVKKSDWEGRKDLTQIETFTIDPDTARDFDDALSVKKTKSGYELMVHIADVSHYVKQDSELDKEAQLRCNSTYFPGTCIPMLPENLSNELCSLKPKVIRLAITVDMKFDSNGDLVSHDIYRSVIKSDARFTYREALEILKGKSNNPHKETLDLMKELCLLLKKQRKMRGSVEFSTPELYVCVNDQGEPTGIDYIEYDITHQLVEEFMLKANETVATHLTKDKKPLTYRIHDQPDSESINEFVRLSIALGYSLHDNPTPMDIQKFFESITNTPFYPFMVTHYIRSMKLAIYSPHNIGHYGLSLEHYCHFTSPIRRYADLIVHRILFGEVKEVSVLETISDKASERERISAKAEQNVRLLKKLRLLVKQMDENPKRSFDAVITKVKSFGIIFEIIGYEIEGYINLSDIHSDYYKYDSNKEVLIGVATNQKLSLGGKIEVYPKAIDIVLLETKWGMIETALPKKGKRKKEKKEKRRRNKR
ncbi:ribonuclease R [Chlamydiales bacterium]|nr:ribonuclease R [Chlamydiales bacterium]